MGGRAIRICCTATLLLALAQGASAQSCANCNTLLPLKICLLWETLTTDEPACFGLINCVQPRMDGPFVEAIDRGDGTFRIRLKIDVRTPFNDAADNNPNGKLDIGWFEGSSADGFGEICENNASDRTWSWLELGFASCADVPLDLGVYSVKALVCNSASCRHEEREEGVSVLVTAQTLGCLDPPTWSCPADGTCRDCLGPGGASSPAGGGPGLAPEGSGPGASLRYTAGGAGSVGMPGAAVWSETLGQGWSHDYAMRIVPDPDETHVWLITELATFRELTDGDADGSYETVFPGSEKRSFQWTGSGWMLTELDGTVHTFDAEGKWLSKTPPEGATYGTTASYGVSGRLERVDFPDGRHELFAYGVDGKLASITEVGIGGSSLVWTYLWAGNDLVRIDRPDGTALELFYEDVRFPGYLTRMELIADVSGEPGSSNDAKERDPKYRRVEGAWEYDASGNVIKTWRGAASFAALEAVDKWLLSFDNPALPTVTTVTDPLGDESTYSYLASDPDRDSVRDRPKLVSISGDCPACNIRENSLLTYDDAVNPYLPTSIVDGRGIETFFTYDQYGQLTSKIEANGDATLARETTWTYDSVFHTQPTVLTLPSIGGSTSERRTDWTLDADGNPTAQTISGVEGGAAFSHPTATVYNAAGRPIEIDPDGHGTADVVRFGYDDVVRGPLVVTSRTDPMVGTTRFGYDPFNRPTSVVEPNGLETTTTYDELDRVTEIRLRGPSSPTDDLVTTYDYTIFGELWRTTLPAGYVIEYGYDAVGRLTSIERKQDASTPGERVLYTLDASGNRTSEKLQRWDGAAAAWITESTTNFQYLNRCQVGSVTRGASVTTYDYDCNGNLESVWDPSRDPTVDAPSVSYVYDALDRLVSVSQPWGGAGGGSAVTSYAYDVQDHLTSVTDAEGNLTTYSYSDRDLLTEEVSPVTGTTTHSYDEHGELTEAIDGRGVTVRRVVDPLDRVTAVDYPDDALDTDYTYDSAPASCGTSAGIGRLASIRRNGQAIDSCYDHFGRLTGDGELSYGYDADGNRTTIVYPGGVTARYSYDFADRQTGLAVTTPLASDRAVASGASYLPSGPLSGLDLGNGVTEARAYDVRYAPERFEVTAPFERLWLYDTDLVGNILGVTERIVCSSAPLVLGPQTVITTEVWEWCSTIEAGGGFMVGAGGDVTLRATDGIVLGDGFSVLSGGKLMAETAPVTGTVEIARSYSYQPDQHYLTGAMGPWGSLAWTYDRIGNRLTETRNDANPDSYVYTSNGSGDTPILDRVDLGGGGSREYTWGAGGHLEEVGTGGANPVDFAWDAAGRLAAANRTAAGTSASFRYDGRDFLALAEQSAGGTASVAPIYDSSGLLHVLERQASPAAPIERTIHFYLAGRPVAQLAIDGAGAETWTYLSTDHLGTPVLATDSLGTVTWDSGFEPFGTDWQAGLPEGALQNGIYLRLPGQWEDGTWSDATSGAGVYYNVHRWYSPATGSYTRPDPLGLRGGLNLYPYAMGNPLSSVDFLGLAPWTCSGVGFQATLVFGGSVQWGRCTSECSGGFRWVINYEWRQLGFGLSLRGSFPGGLSLFTFDDGWPTANPGNFRYAPSELCSTGVSISLLAGPSYGSTQFGEPGGRPSPGAQGGIGGGFFTGCGSFQVLDPRRECCLPSGPEDSGSAPPSGRPEQPPTIGPGQ